MLPVIIADAGPLIALSKLELLNLLPQVFARLIVPKPVLMEATVEGQLGADSVLQFVADNGGFIEILSAVQGEMIDALSVTLGRGEVQAIHWARELGHPVFLDDRRARKHAVANGVQVFGIGGFVLKCKQLGLIDAVVPLLHKLQTHDYFLADALVEKLAVAANEHV